MLARNKLLIGLTVASLMILFSECECVEDMMDNLKMQRCKMRLEK